ncbi:unnamed protein product [Symbiodinium natans]|uniref:Uncharacterized protein n=1 Tax=Symbiodinium natans TaxID=878477 RepID=A0A812Q4Q0_9DINO|nr:unnamed protein product [Symbiodinium natans]
MPDQRVSKITVDGTGRRSLFLDLADTEQGGASEESVLLEGSLGGLAPPPVLTARLPLVPLHRLCLVLSGCLLLAGVATTGLPLKQANPWNLLGLFLPNLGHVDPHGGWIADTWDHFQLPRCDSGPMPGAKQRIAYWVNESVWVPRQPEKIMKGKFWVFGNESDGGHWVPEHTEPAVPGHFISKSVMHHKWVPQAARYFGVAYSTYHV